VAPVKPVKPLMSGIRMIACSAIAKSSQGAIGVGSAVPAVAGNSLARPPANLSVAVQAERSIGSARR
jgi:hypothetical protein